MLTVVVFAYEAKQRFVPAHPTPPSPSLKARSREKLGFKREKPGFKSEKPGFKREKPGFKREKPGFKIDQERSLKLELGLKQTRSEQLRPMRGIISDKPLSHAVFSGS